MFMVVAVQSITRAGLFMVVYLYTGWWSTYSAVLAHETKDKLVDL